MVSWLSLMPPGSANGEPISGECWWKYWSHALSITMEASMCRAVPVQLPELRPPGHIRPFMAVVYSIAILKSLTRLAPGCGEHIMVEPVVIYQDIDRKSVG